MAYTSSTVPISVSIGFDTTAIRGMARFPRSPPFCLLLFLRVLLLVARRLLLLLLRLARRLLRSAVPLDTIYLQPTLFRQKEWDSGRLHCVRQVTHLLPILQLIRPRLNRIRTEQLLDVLHFQVQILPTRLLPLADGPRLHIRTILLRMT